MLANTESLVVDLMPMRAEFMILMSWPRSWLWRQRRRRNNMYTMNSLMLLPALAKRTSPPTSEPQSLGPFTVTFVAIANFSAGGYYEKVFQKLKTNPKYVANEKHRLEALLPKGNLANKK